MRILKNILFSTNQILGFYRPSQNPNPKSDFNIDLNVPIFEIMVNSMYKIMMDQRDTDRLSRTTTPDVSYYAREWP